MITVYTKTICPKCMATKNQLKELGIEFAEVNFDHNPKIADDFREKGYMAAPILQVNEDTIYSDHAQITAVINEMAE